VSSPALGFSTIDLPFEENPTMALTVRLQLQKMCPA